MRVTGNSSSVFCGGFSGSCKVAKVLVVLVVGTIVSFVVIGPRTVAESIVSLFNIEVYYAEQKDQNIKN